MGNCSISGCENKSIQIKLGYCSTHYQRYKKYGDPNILIRPNHGLSKTKCYRSWSAIKTRTTNPNSSHYADYGGRGIKMCLRWRESFLEFYKYIGNPPTEKHTVERINNDGDYEPGNVRWATRHEQNLNQRLRRDNKSGYPGVRQRTDKKWIAYTSLNGRHKHIGVFMTKEEAVIAQKNQDMDLPEWYT